MADAPGSPLWWLRELERRMKRRRATLDRWNAYYEGDHPMSFATQRYREAFAKLFEAFSDNWMPTVVDSVEERLQVEGFRFATSPDDPVSADADAWYAWQANDLDAESGLAHLEALIHGASYVLVDTTMPVAERDGRPVPAVTVEHPSQMIVATSAQNRRERVAALKRWQEDDGGEHAVVYLPDRIYGYRRNRGKWEPFGDGDIVNELGVVPVVPIVNRTRMLGPGVAEHSKVIPLQDVCNKLVADMVVSSEFAAFVQRWATGLDVPEDGNGNQLAPFEVAVDKLLWSSDPETKFGQFAATDLSNYVRAVEMVVQHIASLSRTPPHYLLATSVLPSGESLRAAETGLVAKVRARQRSYGEAWEQVMRLVFRAMDDQRAAAVDAETRWRDPEYRTEAEHVDALTKLKAIGVPDRQLQEDAGYSPQQIARFRAMQAEEALAAVFAAPPTDGSAASETSQAAGAAGGG